MEKPKTALSIRIIFILNEIIFWLFNIVTVLALVLVFLVFINFFREGNQLDLQVRLPVAFSTNLDGMLIGENSSTAVQLLEAYGDIKFPGTPKTISKLFMIPLLLVVGMMYFMLFIFRKFIWSVNRGVIFEFKNIRRLRILALSLLGFWFFWKAYDYVVMITVARRLHFGTIEFTNTTQSHIVLLIFSLVLWVLSHIFLKGLKLEEETRLTI